MKSRTSSSKARIWRKDMTRFAPVWIEYSAFLLVVLYILWGEEVDITGKYSWFVSLFAFVNAVYAFVVAIALFGYLSDPRECNTVHAFPIRREEYFSVHLFSGFLMALIPNALFCLANLPLAGEGNLLFTFGGMMLEFVCFYGLAVFSILLTGRKFAAATVYALVNWLSVLVLWAVDAIYLPLLPGIVLNINSFFKLCPVLGMSLENPDQFQFRHGMSAGQMEYLGICAVVGVVLMVVSLILYRRRKLEYAGDFLAVKWLTPVFLFAFSVACGCVLSLFGRILNEDSAEIMLMIGLLVGYFTGLMLMSRSVKVFNLKALGGAALTAAIILGSMFITVMDPLDRVHYVPEADEIAMVEVAPNESHFDGYISNLYSYHTQDPEIIADLTDLHKEILENPTSPENDHYSGYYVRYHLKNGGTVLRYYSVFSTSDNQELRDRIEFYYSQPEAVLNVSTLEEFHAACDSIEISYYNDQEDQHFLVSGEDRELLMETFFNECKEGNMRTYTDYTASSIDNFYITFYLKDRDVYSGIDVPKSAEATRALCRELLTEYLDSLE